MGWARAAVGLVAVVAAGALLVSGGDEADPRTPDGLPGMPPPFLGVAVLGDGGLTAAVDAYGNVVDLRDGPAGEALIENPADRQAAGTVASDTGIQAWARIAGGPSLPMWRADSVRQRYFPGMSALQTVALFDGARVEIIQAARGQALAMAVDGGGASVGIRGAADLGCERQRDGRAVTLLCSADKRDEGSPLDGVAAADQRWLERGRPLGAAAPGWAERMYERSLLVLRALTDRETGAVAAGARDGWAYVWPRDASAVAIAFASAGYRAEAERVTRFLLGLGLEHAARFHGDGSPIPDRAAQGDAIGWVAAASQAAGFGSARQAAHILAGGEAIPWRDRADYWEGDPGDYLGNAIASHADVSDFKGHSDPGKSDTPLVGLVRVAGEAGSGLDSAAAWAVRPFSMPRLYPAARATLKRLASQATPYGITPGEGWPGGEDPWTAPTAWSAWSLAALGERRQALRMMQALRRAATPAGDLPERVDARTGIPRSTTPLAWSHAFAILALRQLWPS
ncbi:MAG TPA: glycoside hydrolase family 15 protein [Solirubrobacterales bacterium]|nr:glycoside hydrolase family 15 protein [Solirubrobacterales bacterium]